MESEQFDSRLAKREYWDQNFEKELQNFESFGDDGEVWFGADVQKRTINYILEKLPVDTDPYVLDVGTGNGALLFKLAKKGYRRLVGIDYSEASIKFAKRVQEANNEDGVFENISFAFQNAFDLVDSGRFDVIHDKGTFDVVYMNKDLDNKAYAKAMRHRLNRANPSAIFIITSCNCTSAELDEIFTEADGSLFEKVQEIKGYKSFTFGGVTGQVVSTNVYKIPSSQ